MMDSALQMHVIYVPLTLKSGVDRACVGPRERSLAPPGDS